MTTPVSGARPNVAAAQTTRSEASTDSSFEPSGDVTTGGADGMVVDAHRTLRRVGIALGLTAAAAGVALLAARGVRSPAFEGIRSVPNLVPIAIGTGAVGGAAALGSMIGLRPREQAYDKVVDGTLREAGAVAGELGGDVGIVAAGDGRWGLMSLEDAVTDERGAGAARLSNPPIRFAAVTSRDGDTWVRQGEDFVNRGAATAIRASSIDPTDRGSVRSLVGLQVAVGSGGTATVTLGKPLLDGAPSATREQAIGALFEAGVANAALVDTGRGVLAFEARGVTDGALHARGTQLHPVGSVTLATELDTGVTARSATAIGGGLGSVELARPVVDLGAVTVAEASSLEGRRIAGSGSTVERLGKVLSTHASVDEAVAAAAGRGERTLVAKLKDGAALFDVGGRATDPLTTALQPRALQLVEGRKRFDVAADGAVSFRSRSVPYETREALGFVLDTGGVKGTARELLGTYGSREAALAAIRGNLDTTARYAVVEADGASGRFHAYRLEGTDGRTWDQQLGSTTLGAWRNDHVRTSVEEVERRPSTWGTDHYYFDHVTERTVRYADEGDRHVEVASSGVREVSRDLSHIVRAFDPHEPIGHTVRIGGESLRILRWVESTDWESSARSRISTSAADSRAYVVLERENNRGTYHVYEAQEGGHGSSWDTGRADVELASWSEDRARTFEETERRPGRHGTDVYHYDVTERWRERILADGGWTSTVDRTSVNRDRVLDYVDEADPPPPPSSGGGTSPGDDGGWGGGTSPGDDGGSSGGSGTSPGDDGGSGGSGGSGDSSDNGNPGYDDF